MSEWLTSAKVSIGLAAFVGGVLSMSFIEMSMRKRIVAVGSGVAMAHYIATPVAVWVGLETGATGFLIGLFGVSICHLLFRGLQDSDLSVKITDLIDLVRARKGG